MIDSIPQWQRGRISRQAHVGLPPGTVEEEHGRDGFEGPASHLYRLHAPTAWTSAEGPARHRAYDSNLMVPAATLEQTEALWPTSLLSNQHVRIGLHYMAQGRDEFLRNADGDELFFVHQGAGCLRTEYGPLQYRSGDYLVMPRGTTYRFEPTEATMLLVVEAFHSRYRLPDRGLLGRHALFDPAMIEVPEAEAIEEAGDFTVVVKRNGEDTVVHYPFHPCDVVGWKGDLAPMRLNVEDFRPVTSPRFHLPPSVHSTWVADGFIVSTFAPRPMEEDPDALRLPFFHRNVDYDEVIFTHRGQFFSRAGISEGMITFHPTGLHHGPQPQARERDAEAAAKLTAPSESGEPAPRRMANEYAVMIDSVNPLTPGPQAGELEVSGYGDSWAEGRTAAPNAAAELQLNGSGPHK